MYLSVRTNNPHAEIGEHKITLRCSLHILSLSCFRIGSAVMNSFGVSAVFLLLVASLVSVLNAVDTQTIYNHTIIVDSTHRVGNTSCSPFGHSLLCPNLTSALESPRYNSTQYVLKAGPTNKHFLERVVAPFENVVDLAILAENGGNASITCLNKAGLSFINCTSIVLDHVMFVGCGAVRNSTSKDFNNPSNYLTMQTFLVALYFYQCQHVLMNYIIVHNSVNATGVVMYDTIGTNIIANSTFSDNSVSSNQSGGGGFYMEFSYCIPGDNCNESYHQVAFTSNSVYLFHNCTFADNQADTINQSSSGFILPYHENHESFGRGGGLLIYFKGNATNHSITLSNCTFHHNHALWGGGMLVEFDDNSIANNVTIESSIFSHNHCFLKTEYGTGGGVRIASMEQHKEQSPLGMRNHVVFFNCEFNNNAAFNGGAMSIQALLQPNLMTKDQVTTVEVKACIFYSNFGRLGLAINIATLALSIEGELIKVSFMQGCQFHYNTELPDYLKDSGIHGAGKGAVYINGVHVNFTDSVNFTGNNLSALAVVGSHVYFSNCHAVFLENFGLNGGAIALLGNAFIVVNSGTTILFRSNSAYMGGAIYNDYIGMEDLRVYIDCFIKYSNPNTPPEQWESNFTFVDNNASAVANGSHNLGNSIYSTSIRPCSWSASGGLTDNVKDIFCWNKLHWDYGERNCSNEIYTEPNNFTIPNETINVYPGLAFTLMINAWDDLHHLVNSRTVYNAVLNPNTTGMVESQYAVVANNTLAVTGKRGSHNLTLTTTGSRVWNIDLNLFIHECPPGLTLQQSESSMSPSCQCIGTPFLGDIVCVSAQKARLKRGYWMGVIDNSSNLLVGACPERYCKLNDNILPNSTKALEDFVCVRNRAGVLCGECIKGHGHAVNSWEYTCIPCNGTDTAKHTAYYILLFYVPTFFIFLVIIVFDIRLTTGPAVGFILYAQIVYKIFTSNEGFKGITHAADLEHAYYFVYGIFNLDSFSHLGSPFCISPHLNALDLLQLSYLEACFPLLMIVIVIVGVKLKDCFWGRCGRFFRWPQDRGNMQQHRGSTSLVHAFAAFLLLSYTKFSIPSTLTLRRTMLHNESGNPVSERVYLAGDFTVDQRSWYSLLSYIVMILFVALPPLFLLDKPVRWFNHYIAARIHCLRRVWPIDKVNIVLDTFHGCYKPNMGFFAGLYFFFRLAIFVTGGLTETLVQYTIQQILCSIMIALVAVFHPYKNSLFNYVDIFIFLNLAVINSLSNYGDSQIATDGSPNSSITAIFSIRYILIYLPLLYMLTYIIWYIVMTYGAQVKRYLVQSKNALFSCFRKDDGFQLLNSGSVNSEQIDCDSVLLQRAEEPNTYQSVAPAHLTIPTSDTLNCRESDQNQEAQTGQVATNSTAQDSRSQVEVHERTLSSPVED